MPHKILTGIVNLEGQIETITAMELRKTPGDILMQAALGKVFTITKSGLPIATLGPIEPDAIELGAMARRAGIVRG